MREIISLNENWTLSFPKGERPTEQVTLPHTWNAVDGMDRPQRSRCGAG